MKRAAQALGIGLLALAACPSSSPRKSDLGMGDLAAADLAAADLAAADLATRDAGHCGPLIAAAQLYEDVCPTGVTGDRCFFTKPPTDGY